MTAHPQKPTIPEVEPLVRALYATREGAAGCCLHIVLDDGNIDDEDVAFAGETAKTRGHQRCIELARLLLQMSKTQRRKLYSAAHATLPARMLDGLARLSGPAEPPPPLHMHGYQRAHLELLTVAEQYHAQANALGFARMVLL